MKAKQYFKVGINNFSYIWEEFLTHFGEMQVKPKKCVYEFKTLNKPMNDRNILDELKPQEVSLSDFAYILTQNDLLKNGYGNIFYIPDAKGILWAVGAHWDDDGWNVSANSIGHPDDWSADSQVFGRGFLDTIPLTLSSFDPLKLRFSYGDKHYKVVEE